MMNQLRKRRLELGYTAIEMATKIGIRESTLTKWERGESMPSGKYVRLIESAYVMGWHDLMGV